MAATANKHALEGITPAAWEVLLRKLFDRISNDERCAPILAEIGEAHFQLEIRDRPELSYWEDYQGNKVVPHLGTGENCVVMASTTFEVYVGTLLQEISMMEAAADESWELRGDTTVLMRCANLLPYIMNAFADVVAEEDTTEGSDRS